MSKVKIYGCSDDLIEIRGCVEEEFNHSHCDPPGCDFLAFSDGTVLSVSYTAEGVWRVNRIAEGTAEYSKKESPDDGDDYSDVVTLEGEIEWVVFGNRIERAKKQS